jgi:hypothetical protein
MAPVRLLVAMEWRAVPFLLRILNFSDPRKKNKSLSALSTFGTTVLVSMRASYGGSTIPQTTPIFKRSGKGEHPCVF